MSSYPFQRLCCIQPVDGQQPFLLAASGSIIVSLNLKNGSILSCWPNPDTINNGEASSQATDGDGERPSKRQKVETDEPVSMSRQTSEDSIEIISERKKGERRKPKVESLKLPNITHLIATSDGATVIALTAEDKSINVFQVQPAGVLILQSQRSMPKRMCAIVLTPDERTILVGDKFGDVYSLPLHPTNGWVRRKIASNGQHEGYIPSATELTVHTKGNLEALRQQREQKIRNPKKEGPEFELKLLLGHVSLLTDVAIAKIQDGLKQRQYILTSDRDEHIRVSRGVSQAHIIENYCMGHREFVSKLCIVPWNPEFLVAGSGEPSLRIYHWESGRLLDAELFEGEIEQDIVKAFGSNEGRSKGHLAVTGIWPIHYSATENSPTSHHPPHVILVALEGLPILLSYILDARGKLGHHQTLALAGNVLNVGIGPALWDIIVSIDTTHRPGSVRLLRPEETPATEVFETFELFSDLNESKGGDQHTEASSHFGLRWERSSLAMLLNEAAANVARPEIPSEDSSNSRGTYSAIGEILYGLENLRKKRGQDARNAEDEDQLEDAIAEAE